MEYKTKAKIRKKGSNTLVDIEEDFSTPDEFDELREKLGSLDREKYLSLAREALRFRKEFPQFEKGIAYSMCGWGSHLAEKHDDIYDIMLEFGDLELPDEICSGSWDEVERLIDVAEKKTH